MCMQLSYLLFLEWFGSDGETHSVHRLLEIGWHSNGLSIGKHKTITLCMHASPKIFKTSTAVCSSTCIFSRACLASLKAPVCLAWLARVNRTALDQQWSRNQTFSLFHLIQLTQEAIKSVFMKEVHNTYTAKDWAMRLVAVCCITRIAIFATWLVQWTKA